MTNLIENSTWESGIYQIETDDPTLGGQPGFNMGEPVTGHANAQAQQLANRTVWLKDAIDSINASLQFAVVVTESTVSRISALSDAGCYVRFTNPSSKTYTIEPQTSVPWLANTEIHGRNAGTNNLTLIPGSGVTLNAPFGGTLMIPTGGTFTLKRAAQDEWDVIGQTVAA